MEMKQMMACLPAKIKAEIRNNQAKTDVSPKEMRVGQEFLKDGKLAKMESTRKG
jgi:hypothetical protein